MKKDTPFISIVMAVHNGTKYIPVAMNSILRQTCQEWEFIIVDDGSDEPTDQILNRWARKDARIRLLKQENQGLAVALNRGIRHARGTYIARMDGDDISYPARLRVQCEYMNKNPDTVALGSWVRAIDPDGDPLCIYQRPQNHVEIVSRLYQGHTGQLFHPSMMIRHEALHRIGGYAEDYRYAQDYDLLLRLSELGLLANIPHVLLDYRLHLQNISHVKSQQQESFAQLALERYYQRKGVSLPPGTRVARGPQYQGIECHYAWAHMAKEAGYHTSARKHAWLYHQHHQTRRSWELVLFCDKRACIRQKIRTGIKRVILKIPYLWRYADAL